LNPPGNGTKTYGTTSVEQLCLAEFETG